MFTLIATLSFSAVHCALAAAVTLHVLAYKRDPGSAVAWIGLAWLSPVVGSLLYALLGINRVRRRARSLRRATATALPVEQSPPPRATITWLPSRWPPVASAGGVSNPATPSPC